MHEVYAPPFTVPSGIRFLRKLGVSSGTRSVSLDEFLKREKFDFVYPYFSENRTNFRSAAWIYDFQHKHLPQFFSQEEIDHREKYFELIASHAPIVVLSSRACEQDFKHAFPRFAHKSRVLSFRVSPRREWYLPNPVETQRKYGLPDKFLLISNQFWQHKNHLVVFEALSLLRSRSILPVVVCTGIIHDHRNPAYSDSIVEAIERLGIGKQLHLLGLIPRLDQVQLMRRCLAVVQPSLYEGWSTVVEDARLLGKPVILSDIPVHVEQNPPQSLFFERESPSSLAALIEECWGTMLPGPNMEQETTARARGLEEIQDYGLRFLDIAKNRENCRPAIEK